MKKENPAIAFSHLPFGAYGNFSLHCKFAPPSDEGPMLAMAKQLTGGSNQPTHAGRDARKATPMAAARVSYVDEPLRQNVDPRVVLGVIKPPNPYDD